MAFVHSGGLDTCDASFSQQDDILALLKAFLTLPRGPGARFLYDIVAILRATASSQQMTPLGDTVLRRIHGLILLHHETSEVRPARSYSINYSV